MCANKDCFPNSSVPSPVHLASKLNLIISSSSSGFDTSLAHPFSTNYILVYLCKRSLSTFFCYFLTMSPVFLSSGSSITSTPFSFILQVIPPALMLILPLVSAVLLAHSPFSRNKLVSNILLALNTVLPAIASGLGLGASLGQVQFLQHYWNISLALHACLCKH